MKRNILAALAIIFLAAATPALAANNAAHDQGHAHSEAPATLELNAGKKWETDAALRKAMGDIRQAMAAALHTIHENRLSAKGYGTLAGKVEAAVNAMITQCKLGTKADAQLHIIIADLLAGAEQMAGKVKPVKRMDGAVKTIGALDNYGKYFDDPGFQPIVH